MRIVTLNITGYQWDLFTTALLILLVPRCWCPGVEPALQFVFICLTERSSTYLSHFCWHVCIHGCTWEGTSLLFSLYFQSGKSFHYRSVFIISIPESCSACIREIPPAKWHRVLVQKLCMWLLKPIKVETKNNLSFETSTKTDFFQMSIGLRFETKLILRVTLIPCL